MNTSRARSPAVLSLMRGNRKEKKKEGIYPVFEGIFHPTLGLVCFSYEDFILRNIYNKAHKSDDRMLPLLSFCKEASL